MCANIPKKGVILSVLMYVFARGMTFLSENDRRFAEIISDIPDDFTLLLNVRNSNLKTALSKSNGIFKRIEKDEDSDLILTFNNLCSAVLVFGGLMPQHTAFAQHRLSIKGNVADALLITRAINRLQAVIFPDVISKRLIKEFQKSNLKERYLFAKFYFYGLIL